MIQRSRCDGLDDEIRIPVSELPGILREALREALTENERGRFAPATVVDAIANSIARILVGKSTSGE